MGMIKKFLLVLLILFLVLLPVAAQDIHDAARHGDLARVKTLISNDQKLVNSKNDHGFTPLHFAALSGSREVVQFLLAKGAEVDIRDINARTPLFFAARRGNLELCRLLLEKGAAVNARNKYDRTPLLYAAWSDNSELVQMLISKGAEVNIRDTEGYMPLHHVCIEGSREIAGVLIGGGADIDVKDHGGDTPLHLASFYGHQGLVELLIARGGAVNVKDERGDTPLHGAAWGGHEETVELLIAKGADVNVENSDARTPLDNARKLGHDKIVSLLTVKGAAAGVSARALKITVLYDNYVFAEGTKADWGFACLIEGTEKTILFDTGGKPEVLMHNVEQLKVDLQQVDLIAISHNHWDHTGGLLKVLEKRPNVDVYLPYSFPYSFVRQVEGAGARVVPVKESRKLCNNIFLTGEMGDEIKEQSLILDTPKGLVIVTGCSHQGIVNILKRAKEILHKNIFLVFGGFHLMGHSPAQVEEIIREFKKLGVEKCGATHCTGDEAIRMFREAYGKNYVRIGAGRVLKMSD
jgi:7,8-dihydropterin-6-yl-methyl-4-(beta-D-ribofuranosyl)aminobenzene 5'-phosphate synthase